MFGNHVGKWAVTSAAVLMILASAAACGGEPPRVATPPSALAGLSRVHHVWMITLENEGFSTTFGPASSAPYLSQTLAGQGALLTAYYGTTHASLGNYIAMISGQSGSPATQSDCTIFEDFKATGVTPDGQAIGDGCVYPANIKTLPDQLMAAKKTWKAYMEDMGNDPQRERSTCGHPVVGAKDLTQKAQGPSAAVPLGDQYASRHDPFVYFHSIIDSPVCDQDVVNLKRLKSDLVSIAGTPDFSFITPNLCRDGHDGGAPPKRQCVNGEPGGLISADAFLKEYVPLITGSPAFKQDGLLIINFDEGSYASAVQSDGGQTITFLGEACCNQQLGPNVGRFPKTESIGGSGYTVVMQGMGGDNTGAVLLSPFIKPGTVSKVGYNHYSLLKTLEDIFGLDGYLGYAAQPGLVEFGSDISSGAS